METSLTESDAGTLVSFEGDLPVPEVNLTLYKRVYVLEQWARRVLLAALMARYGMAWQGALPTDISKRLKPRLQQLSNRVAFDTENSSNAIWAMTLDELRALLVYEKLWPMVKRLTGFTRADWGIALMTFARSGTSSDITAPLTIIL